MQRIFYLILFFIAGSNLHSQQDVRFEVTKDLFIKDAFVVSKPGASPVKQSVLIKDGIISQIGVDLKSPYDCKIIQADSLYLYAGFIDAMSYTGIKKEEENKDAPKPPSKGEANYEQSGITPQVTALSKLSIKESSIADMRKAGFTISHVFPRGKMIAGKSDIISLKNVDHEDKLIVKHNVALHSSFTPASNVYPSTVIGVFAKFRDLYKNTTLYADNVKKYYVNSLGVKKPNYSEELEAMMLVQQKQQTVYFVAKDVKDVFRAIELQKEIGFNMVLADVQNITNALDKVKAGNYPVLLSLDLPEEIKKEIKTDSATLLKGPSPEKINFEALRKKSYDEQISQASLLEKNNITFSFSNLDYKPSDVLKSIRRYIKAGLSEKAALAALTTTPASLLNIGYITATIETGKLANMVLTIKPLFDEKSTIKMVIVEGKEFEVEEKKKSEDKSDKSKSAITGTWSYSVDSPEGTKSGKIIIKKSGDTFEGEVIDNDKPSDIMKMSDLIIEDKEVRFNITANLGQATKVDFILTFEKETFTGKVDVANIGNFSIKGDKLKGPEKLF